MDLPRLFSASRDGFEALQREGPAVRDAATADLLDHVLDSDATADALNAAAARAQTTRIRAGDADVWVRADKELDHIAVDIPVDHDAAMQARAAFVGDERAVTESLALLGSGNLRAPASAAMLASLAALLPSARTDPVPERALHRWQQRVPGLAAVRLAGPVDLPEGPALRIELQLTSHAQASLRAGAPLPDVTTCSRLAMWPIRRLLGSLPFKTRLALTLGEMLASARLAPSDGEGGRRTAWFELGGVMFGVTREQSIVNLVVPSRRADLASTRTNPAPNSSLAEEIAIAVDSTVPLGDALTAGIAALTIVAADNRFRAFEVPSVLELRPFLAAEGYGQLIGMGIHGPGPENMYLMCGAHPDAIGLPFAQHLRMRFDLAAPSAA